MKPTGCGCWIFEINDLTCDVFRCEICIASIWDSSTQFVKRTCIHGRCQLGCCLRCYLFLCPVQTPKMHQPSRTTTLPSLFSIWRYMSSKKKYTSEFYLTVSSWFFLLLLLKRNFFFLQKQCHPKVLIYNRNLGKKSCFPNWEIPKNPSPFLRAPKKNQRPKVTARYGQPQKRRAMKRLKFCWMRLPAAMPRLDSPQRLCLGGLFTGSPGGQTPTRKPVSSTRICLPSTRKKTYFPQKTCVSLLPTRIHNTLPKKNMKYVYM